MRVRMLTVSIVLAACNPSAPSAVDKAPVANRGSGGNAVGTSGPVTKKPTRPGEPGSTYGGNGKPAYWDDGHPHGPGGPVYMGRGPDCNAKRDHCMRPGVYFGVDDLVPGKLYRATPIYELDGKWYNWRGKEENFGKKFKTKVGTKETIKVGDPIIWFIDESGSKRFVDVEYEALTSSRWEVGYVEQLMSGDKVRVKGLTDLATFDTIRVIVDTK